LAQRKLNKIKSYETVGGTIVYLEKEKKKINCKVEAN